MSSLEMREVLIPSMLSFVVTGYVSTGGFDV